MKPIESPPMASHRSVRAFLVPSIAPLALALALFPLSARADGQDDKGVALALFEQGRTLIAQGDYEKAVPKFEGAAKLLHTFGILFNLADCYEKLGRTASAWSTWREAGSVARNSNRADDEARAEERQRALAPKISELTLRVPQAAELDTLEIARNGAPVPRAAWETPLPVDPGQQTIDARAPGHRAQHLTLVVLPNGDKKTLTIPPLELETAAPVPSSAPSADRDNPSASPPSGPVSSAPSGHPVRVLAGWIAAGAGAALAAGGIIEWAVGQNKMNDAVTHANAAVAANDRGAYNAASDDLSSGNSQRTTGFVLLGVGGAVAVAGAAFALTAPHADSTPHPATSTTLAPWMGPGAIGVACRGRW